jgi:hypothetical protein
MGSMHREKAIMNRQIAQAIIAYPKVVMLDPSILEAHGELTVKRDWVDPGEVSPGS